jgi:hypothetical protein
MAGKSMKLGGGGRFAKVEAEARAHGARDPAAVAAAVGRKKYGQAKMTSMATAGRKREERREHHGEAQVIHHVHHVVYHGGGRGK